ncbi:hypothetical protein NQ317_000991 [Molorchus minor]|uniref:B box-type domain-containing protein n=1 Tax=Molorchus minor TaxID=1323400 RepID=A0ABQ9JPA4_9CUCU|nr:hypothetical protein NQ317_000991 [Molorchus minor]
MECDVCKENKEVFKCDGCGGTLCKTCGRLTSSEVKVLQLSNRVMRFYISKCRKTETFSLFRKIIEIVKKTSEVLVVKPKQTSQESSKTKQVIEEKINPSSLGVGVSRIKYVKEGGVAISYNRQQDVENISQSIQQQLGEEYEVNIPKKKNPKIRIMNIDRRLLTDQEELIEKIIIQNTISTPPS